MKKLLLIVLLSLLAFPMMAVPARPRPVTVKQGDGSYITIQLHGDEYCHWATTGNGTVVAMDEHGMYKPAAAPTQAIKRAAAARHAMYNAERKAAPSLSMGEKRFLVLLIEFSDTVFTVPEPKQAFSRMLNEKGYSANGGTGSAADYYTENSSGAFTPIFDVFGPVRVSGTQASYGKNNSSGNDANPGGLLAEACAIASRQGLNFSNYDNDHDLVVDNIFFYYAGHNEAEGGGTNSIWPHASYLVGGNAASYNGVQLYRYACTSEYSDDTGRRMCGIGTFCHEFGHVLGLPDFYDINYETDGEAASLSHFSLMDSGSYNNDGCSPPYLNAIERNMLGWMGEPTVITEPGNYTLGCIQDNKAFRINTRTEGEYFLLETRTAEGWDAYIRSSSTDFARGLLVYHVDQSNNDVHGATAESYWRSGRNINAFADHPCFYIEKAESNPGSYADFLFPGPKGKNREFSDITNPTSRSWDGETTGYEVNDIAYASGQTTFTLRYFDGRLVFGTVTDSSGNPLPDAEVALSVTEEEESEVNRMIAGRKIKALRAPFKTAFSRQTSGSDGSFSFLLDESTPANLTLAVSCGGYMTYTYDFSLKSGRKKKNVILKRFDEQNIEGLANFKEADIYSGLSTGSNPLTFQLGTVFSSEMLKRYQGMKVSSVSFVFFAEQAQAVDAFVDFGTERQIQVAATNPGFLKNNRFTWTSVNMENYGVLIPENTDVVCGYAIQNASSAGGDFYPITVDTTYYDSGDLIKFEYNRKGGGWMSLGYKDKNGKMLYFHGVIVLSLVDNVSPYYKFRLFTIKNPSEGKPYSAGTNFRLCFTEENIGAEYSSVKWYFDDELQTSDSVVLTPGRHVVTAEITWPSGGVEKIVQIISVE